MSSNINRLPSSTASLLSATYTISTYDAAVLLITKAALYSGASTIRLTLHPESLRFSLQDDAPPIPLTSLPPNKPSGPRAHLLQTLSSLCSLELQAKSNLISYLVHLRRNTLLDVSYQPTSLQSKGSLLDVWELFCITPVRRRVHSSIPTSTILNTIREGLVAMAIAFPCTNIHVSVTNNPSFMSISANKHSSNALSLSRISHALDCPLLSKEDWTKVNVRNADGAHMIGFVRRPISTATKLLSPRVISIDGSSTSLDTWPHRVALRTLRTPTYRTVAYVLTITSPPGHPITLLDPSSERWYTRWIADSLRSRTTMSSASTIVKVQPQSINTLKRERPASAPTPALRFQETLICRRVRKRPRTALVRTPVTSRSRPVPSFSAAAVVAAYTRVAPSWRDKILSSRPSNSFLKSYRNTNCNDTLDSVPVSIAKKDIPKLRIVGQVDCKFIVVSQEEKALHVIDQHAASERYMYERLLKSVEKQISKVDINPPKQIALSNLHKSTAQSKEELLHKWGWSVSIPVQGPVLLLQAPKLRNQQIALDEREQLVSFLESLQEGASLDDIPKPIVDVISTAACHAAVRFGDKLTKEMCESIVWSLAECDNPFICAHGRPSIVPLVKFVQKDNSNHL